MSRPAASASRIPARDGGRQSEIVGAEREFWREEIDMDMVRRSDANSPLSCAFLRRGLDIPANMPLRTPRARRRKGRNVQCLTERSVAAPELTVVVPVFNESGNLRPLVARLVPALACVESFEDRSSSTTARATTRSKCCAPSTPRIRACGRISFSRNFGKEIAIAAGVDSARGRAAVIMDADLQHPPEAIAEFVAKWREGYQNIYGVSRSRETDSRGAPLAHRHFYRLFGAFGEIEPARGRRRFPPARPRGARRAEETCASGRGFPRASMPGSASNPSACPSRSRSVIPATRNSPTAS